ncbi:MAG: hypothetical protein NZ958_03435 [Bacteroidia bacterium]|nr:hypothetical protein [Bacteroidia bacterium]MDW8088271.1 hypothetical protein [Bacteroidia bacterium]
MAWVILAYIGALWGISYWAGRWYGSSTLNTYYVAGRRTHWLWVSYGMVGTALSGLTFLGVPASVQSQGWTYLQVVVGYLVGYGIIAWGLLPLYYRHAQASIYEYFRHTLGPAAEKTAAVFFLLARGFGSSLRLFLALWALQPFLNAMPLPLLAALSLALILLYTLRTGIAAIIYTDLFQTTLFLSAAAITVALLWPEALRSEFHFPRVIELQLAHPHFFLKDFLGGVLIALAMTGLDQDQMQKNLSLPTLRAAQKNILLYGLLLLPVNGLFLFLGSLLWAYAQSKGLIVSQPDRIFAEVVRHEGGLFQVLFVLGVASAALSSADGTLAALTTATLRNLLPARYETLRMKNLILLMWTGIFWALMLLYQHLSPKGLILQTFLKFSGYLYGPLLGLFLFSRLGVPIREGLVPWGVVGSLGLAVVIEYGLNWDLGYGSIGWIALGSGGGMWLLSRAFPKRPHASAARRAHKPEIFPDLPQSKSAA